ncbi:hypothetical protein ACJMK2_011046, partial [Sinanodonta woodiana]
MNIFTTKHVPTDNIFNSTLSMINTIQIQIEICIAFHSPPNPSIQSNFEIKMKNGVLHCVVSLLVCVQSATTSPETVWLRDVTSELQTDKRILGDLDLPDELTFIFSRGSKSLNINLRRNYEIDPNVDVYVVQKSTIGRVHVTKSGNLEHEDVAYYQDVDNGAFMTVRCIKRSGGHCARVINGNIEIEGINYDLRPSETGVTLRSVLESNYLRGTKYVIEDQEQVGRRTAAWKGEAEQENVKNVDQTFLEHVGLLRRGEDKLNNYFSPDDALSSRNVEDFNEEVIEEEVRNPKNNYYVEMGILVDSGIWDLHSSLIQISDKDEKDLEVQRSIREYFSHIINGVNLRYKGIKDDSISITVTLREFFLFKREDIFPHNKSLVLRDEGETYIEVDEYLSDIRNWDIDYSDMLVPFDHAMLFTRHDLYEKQLSNNIVAGLSFTGGVCDIGDRTSVIQVQDYFQTVHAAAHELGHNLGADHDGENRCTACPAEDLYTMSKQFPQFGKSKTFSKNPWLFSTCSVDLFKSTLRQKDCVTNIGVIYDDAEWKTNVARPPGRAYTHRQQCQHIKGPNSDFCGAVSEDICLFMKCLDPKTGQCFKESFSAARGTKCGRKMWCIEGECVSR